MPPPWNRIARTPGAVCHRPDRRSGASNRNLATLRPFGRIAGPPKAAGGCEKLNRHVGGAELCWGLRDYALNRWGMLARVVLESWNIQSTDDFGRIVFGFIDLDLMQKQAGDKIEDFQKIFSFDDAFRTPFPPVPGTAHDDDDEP